MFGAAVNRTQRLVLAFVVLTWSTVVAILLLSPEVYDGAAGHGRDAHRWLVDLGLLVVLTVPLGFLAVAVVRRWRWAFWLVLAAFLAGLLRVPAAALQLSGHLSTGDPSWYVVLQAVFGVVQFLIAAVMLTGYRRSGVWGEP
jgi:hypothetical protein